MKKTRRFSVLAAAILAVGMITACGGKATTETKAETKVETTAQTAAKETTAKETTAAQVVKVPMTIVNKTGIEIYGLYASPEGSDTWEEDILGENILAVDETGTGTFEMTADSLVWDFAIEDKDQNMIEFYGLDFTNNDSSGVTVTFTYDGTNATAEITDTKDAKETSASESIILPVTIINKTGVEISGLYASPDGSDTWEENMLEGTTLADGEKGQSKFEIDSKRLVWDFAIEDKDDN